MLKVVDSTRDTQSSQRPRGFAPPPVRQKVWQPFVAEIISEDEDNPAVYVVKRMIPDREDSGEFKDAPNRVGTFDNVRDMNGISGMVPGARVMVSPWTRDNEDTLRWRMFSIPRGVRFDVHLIEDGSGVAGTDTTQATFKYTVMDATNTIELGTSMSPRQQRPPKGKLVSGDGLKGSGLFDGAGDFVLADANETLDTSGC